jgi:hypothetical protein
LNNAHSFYITVAQASACVVLIFGEQKSREHRLKPVPLKTVHSGLSMQETESALQQL